MSVAAKDNDPLRLSVIVFSTYSGPSLENCLQSLFNNKFPEKIEIIVVCKNLNRPVSDLSVSFPDIQFIEFSEKTALPRLIAAGITKSQGEVIALLGSACTADENWITAVLCAHQSPNIIFGGAVKPLYEKMSSLDLAIYLCEYGQFAPPLKRGTSAALPGNNFSFKRKALNIGNELTDPKFWKSLWCEQLVQSGIELTLEPDISVSYARNFSFSFLLKRRFRHGRCFAGMRNRKLTVLKRLFYFGGSIFLPVIFLYRISMSIAGKNFPLSELIPALPFILVGVLGWSAGEFSGYLAGAGKSCDYID